MKWIFPTVVAGANPNWSTIGGRLTQLDVSPAGIAWGVNKDDHIFVKNVNGWHRVGGTLTHVSVGDAGVWGVNRDGHIYYREGVTLGSPVGTSWTHIPGRDKCFIS